MTRKYPLLVFTIIFLIGLTSAIYCGDGSINQQIEQCDGSDLGGQTCQSLGLGNGILSCYSDGTQRTPGLCILDTINCFDTCGDGTTDPWEDCDFNDPFWSSPPIYGLPLYPICTPECTVEEIPGEYCGDGIPNGPEQCDGTPDCGENCQIEELEKPIIIPDIDPDEPFCYEDLEVCAEITTTTPLIYITMSCNSGNTQINKTMTLQSGNTYCAGLSNSTIGAINGIEVECSITAENQAGSTTETIGTEYDCPDCGNGIIERTETCDNSNLNGILCNAGYDSFCSYCTDSCEEETIQGPYCGDSYCQPEIEDWQNCNQDCEKPAICGDNILDANEQCDLGILLNTDIPCNPLYDQSCLYCSLTCQNETEEGEFCGDQICNSEFENWTSCNEDCEKPQICGDGFVDINEECDGGENCLSDCTLKEEDERSYSSHSSITKYYDDCTSIWECSQWGECDTDVKHRECIDINHCQYGYNEPMETIGCEVIKESQIEKSNTPWLFIILAILAFILVLLFIFSKK